MHGNLDTLHNAADGLSFEGDEEAEYVSAEATNKERDNWAAEWYAELIVEHD
ncbi:hypothetical protein L665_02274 [Ralstonia solanacearum SD54]|nr:hypothetical protein L665_02274 [Ralstonia solanacearum SD54]